MKNKIYYNEFIVKMSGRISEEGVYVDHNAGFFSNCSVRLHYIVEYINKFKKFPPNVDTSRQFSWHKNREHKRKDITFDYFEHYDKIKIDIPNNLPIDYHWGKQHGIYKDLDYEKITPVIEKYFSPNDEIKEKISELEKKYEIDYNNICVLFYRGNCKEREEPPPPWDTYELEVDKILKKEPNIRFLIQSDETGFIEHFSKKYPNHVIFNDEIRHMQKRNCTVDEAIGNNYYFSKYFLSIVIIISKCKYIFCGSGNCSIWMLHYRGNSRGLFQFLRDRWYES